MSAKSFFSIFLFSSFLFLTSCDTGQQQARVLTEANGGKYYGGVFRINEVEFLRSLYPHNITEVGGSRIANQIYEGLVKMNQETLLIEPLIAESWEIDSQATLFTFQLRQDVYFHDDPCFPDGKGRLVNAHDFVWSFNKLCEASITNQGFWIFENRVKGANEYYASTIEGNPLPEGVSGIRALDDFTLQIELEEPFASFLYILAMNFTSVFPHEAYEKYGRDMRIHTVGTGPFKLTAIRQDETVILSRNENYWRVDEHGNALPYLDGVRVSFINDKKAELLEFRKGNLDMMYRLPLELIYDVINRNDELQPDYSKYQLQYTPTLAIQYYGFLHTNPLFDDINVRKAFNYAINRQTIADFTLKGTGIAAENGFIPPSMPGYNAENVTGYSYNPEKAREYMSKAGYPNGNGFPPVTLQINTGGGLNEQVAEAAQKMLEETLNIRVNMTRLPFAQHLENIETGKTDFWRSGWIGSYPDPEYFLNLFHSIHIPDREDDKSYLNSIRYRSARYDSVFEAALQTVDFDERMQLYEVADNIMMEDAAIIPIFYYKDHRILQPYVRNFHQNPLEHRDLSTVFFVPE
ncbi:MAG: ABC transporter substrate-binding protein [Chitinophagaceae bacterium]|nr:MAG: ABC transporter substrate-binding protein [Chitinophagaceae bacterium]